MLELFMAFILWLIIILPVLFILSIPAFIIFILYKAMSLESQQGDWFDKD